MTRSVEERFWKKVERGADCWIWVGARDRRPHRAVGFFGALGEVLAHRAAWRLFRGDIPDGQNVRVVCGTSYCVRPEHMLCGPRVYDSPNSDERFWRRVEKSEGCWLWTGPLDQYGYGRLTVRDRHAAAHRVAWALTNGPIPGGLQVLHRCDNPPCVCPDHLFLGTQADNLADAVGKGRLVLRGSGASGAKLTEDDIRAIRASDDRQVAMASRYGVTQAAISAIRLRKTWAHLP